MRLTPLWTATIALAACQSPQPPQAPALIGLMDAVEIDVASKVPGRIATIEVREGDEVKPGQVLATIQTHELEARIAQVNAGIEAAQAKLRMARKGARKEEKRAVAKQLRAAKHQAELAEKMVKRMRKLHAQKALPQAKLDEAEMRHKVALEQVAMAEAKRAMVRKGARDEEIEALEALVRKAQATLDEVRTYAEEKEQRAPIAAEVAQVVLRPGELAATGHPIITLVDLSDQWATFAVREDKLADLRVGHAIQVQIPALGEAPREMEIFHIAALGDFATWRATSAKDSFDLKTFEVRARPKAPIEGLRPGMTVRWALGR